MAFELQSVFSHSLAGWLPGGRAGVRGSMNGTSVLGPSLRWDDGALPHSSLSIFQSFNLSIYPSFNLSISQSIHLSIFQSFHLSTSIFPSTRQTRTSATPLSISASSSFNLSISPSFNLSLAYWASVDVCRYRCGHAPAARDFSSLIYGSTQHWSPYHLSAGLSI